jgi:hypothetical protein
VFWYWRRRPGWVNRQLLQRATKMTRLTEQIAKFKEEMRRLQVLEAQILATPDHQISTDRSRCAFDGDERPWLRRRGLQCPSRVDTKHYLIITHEVTDIGTDRSQLANVVATKQTKAALGVASLDAIADRGYFISAEILECETRTSPSRCRSR